jgi:hypothetical protein
MEWRSGTRELADEDEVQMEKYHLRHGRKKKDQE